MPSLALPCFAFYEGNMAKSEKPSVFQAERAPLDVTFLVFSGSSIMCVASAIDPLRAANRIAGETLFDYKLVSVSGDPAITTCGLPVAVSGKFDPSATTDMIVVVAGFGTQGYATASFLQGLRRAARSARACGGVEAGTWLVARAGLLEGPRRNHALGGHGGFRRRLSRHRRAGRTATSSTDRSSPPAAPRRPST